MKSRLILLIVLTWAGFLQVKADDLRRVVSLDGYWKFTVGDDIAWANPAYDDSNWDHLTVPGRWEDQGYNDYNGFAWYRKRFNPGILPANMPIILVLGRIDDADVVYLNGKVLGKSGDFPPEYHTAYNRNRRYVIPAGMLKPDADNVIAIRVYDSYQEGGVVSGPVGLYTDGDLSLLSVSLTGRWKFHPGDNKQWKAVDVDDSMWPRVHVPSDWENEGFPDYDGCGWYRVEFRIPKGAPQGDLYLVLGKIDDVDEVYLNGKYVGSVYDLKKDGEYRYKGMEYNARRAYKINSKALNYAGTNTLAVRVYDEKQRGGIYEGPVGIMTPDNYRKYRNKHYRSQSFVDFIIDSFTNE
jgi:beta-galactosidase/beta-glucuronidase